MKSHYIFVLSICLFFLLVGRGEAQYNQSSLNAPQVQINQQQIKTTSKARNIAVTNTVVPLVVGIGTVALFENSTIQTIGASLAVYGLASGPSTGNFYAEDYARGFVGMAIRGTGMILMKDATSEVLGNRFSNAFPVDKKKVSLTDTRNLIGGALILGSAIYNVISAKKSVEQYQEQRNSFALDVSSANIDQETVPLLAARIHF